MNDIKRDPLDLLLRIQQAQAGEDVGDGSLNVRRGVGFEINGVQLVASLEQVSEIVKAEDITPVPLTPNWVLGVSNVRGNVFTIVDLPGFLGFKVKAIRSAINVIVLSAKGFRTAVRVSEVRGLRQLPEEMAEGQLEEMNERIRPYVNRVLHLEDGVWGEFDFMKLAQTDEFNSVGASEDAA